MTDIDPKVSVVVPTYNRPRCLRRSLRSIASQSYDNLEVIVVDDCSTVPASRVVDNLRQEVPYEIRVVRHEQNRGANAARNTGIEIATGEFLAFLDDDDAWYAEKIAKQIEAFRAADPAVGLVYCEMDILDQDGAVIRQTDADHSGNVTKALLRSNVIGSFSSVLVRRKIIDEAGLLDERFPSWQDLEWYIRLSQHCEVAPIPEPLVAYHVDTHDQLTDDVESVVESTYPLFVGKFRPIAAEFGPRFEREMLAWAAFRTGAWYALPNGRYQIARLYILRAITLYPLCRSFYPYLLLSLLGPRAYDMAVALKHRFDQIFHL